MFSLSYACISHIGKRRRMNQDNFICAGAWMEPGSDTTLRRLSGDLSLEEPRLLGVFDGLGGEERGEVASCLAAETAAGWRFGGDAGAEARALCRRASDRIRAFTREQGLRAVGTTAALAVFGPEKVTLCNVGDSRIYLLSGGELRQLSLDHSSTAPCAGKPPLTQALGLPPAGGELDPHLERCRLRPGDRYLLCSDGLTDMVSGRAIAQLLRVPSPTEAAELLLQAALDGGGRDNITMIVCRVDGEKQGLLARLLRR